MAETALAGKGGTVYIPGTPLTPITDIHQWTLTVDAGNYDASVLGDSWRHFVPGLRGWNGAINGYWNLINDTTGQFLLSTALLTSSSVVLQLQVNATTGGFYEGTANITQFAVSDPVDGLITIDFTYVGTGSLQHQP
jgi:predicted secreted protein